MDIGNGMLLWKKRLGMGCRGRNKIFDFMAGITIKISMLRP